LHARTDFAVSLPVLLQEFAPQKSKAFLRGALWLSPQGVTARTAIFANDGRYPLRLILCEFFEENIFFKKFAQNCVFGLSSPK